MKKTILIGGTRAQKLPALVCEYSIRRQTKAEIEIVHGYDDAKIDALRPENTTRTGFSFQRFTLPARGNQQPLGLNVRFFLFREQTPKIAVYRLNRKNVLNLVLTQDNNPLSGI